jgi:hypothetical protein
MIHNHIRRLTQLYEQKKASTKNWKMLLDDYQQHWITRIISGIPSSKINFDSEIKMLKVFS